MPAVDAATGEVL